MRARLGRHIAGRRLVAGALARAALTGSRRCEWCRESTRAGGNLPGCGHCLRRSVARLLIDLRRRRSPALQREQFLQLLILLLRLVFLADHWLRRRHWLAGE